MATSQAAAKQELDKANKNDANEVAKKDGETDPKTDSDLKDKAKAKARKQKKRQEKNLKKASTTEAMVTSSVSTNVAATISSATTAVSTNTVYPTNAATSDAAGSAAVASFQTTIPANNTGNAASAKNVKGTFDILQLPFYRALSLFENGKYQESFPLFLECARRANFYAYFYLQYLTSNNKISISITAEQAIEVKQILEFIDMIPRKNKPEAWCQASVLLIDLKEAIGNANVKRMKNCISALYELRLHSPIASVGIVQIYRATKLKHITSQILTDCSSAATNSRSLWALNAMKENNALLKRQAEWDFVAVNANVERSDGELERMLAKNQQISEEKTLWMISAALMGDLLAQIAIQEMCANFSSPENHHRWTLATALNHGPGAELYIGNALFLGTMPTFGKDIPKAKLFLQRGLSNAALTNVKEIEENIAQCHLCLASIYEVGDGGGDKDVVAALKHYKAALGEKRYVPYYKIGELYFRGQGGVERNFRLAEDHLLKALSIINDPETIKTMSDNLLKEKPILTAYICKLLAKMYDVGGFGITENQTLATDYYRKGSEHNAECLESYAIQLYNGLGCEPDKVLGIELMVKAANLGRPYAAFNVSQFYVKGFIENPLQYNLSESRILDYLRLAEKTIKQTASYFGHFYLNKKDYQAAWPYLQTGEQLNQAESLNALGYLYERGCPELKLAKDAKKAFEYYSRTAAQGDPVGMSNKGLLLLHGNGTEKNENEAKELFEDALAKEYKLAAYNLYAMYSHGWGVPQDLAIAFRFLKEAEVTRDPDVLFNLALVYDKGEGIPEDRILGTEYLLQAVQAGHANASLFLAWHLLDILPFNDENAGIIDEYLALPYAEGHHRAIFLRNLIRLFKEPTQSAVVLTELKAAQKTLSEMNKRFTRIELAIQLLEQRKEIRKAEIWVLLYKADLKTIQQIDDVVRETEKTSADVSAVVAKKNSESANTVKPSSATTAPSSATANSGATARATMAKVVPDPVAPNVILNPKLTKLLTKMGEYTNPKNAKQQDYAEFQLIVKKVLGLTGVSNRISRSKGSNVNYRVQFPNTKPLCFSYHPKHSANQRPDEFDPNRAKSRQTYISELKMALERDLAADTAVTTPTKAASTASTITTSSAASMASTASTAATAAATSRQPSPPPPSAVTALRWSSTTITASSDSVVFVQQKGNNKGRRKTKK